MTRGVIHAVDVLSDLEKARVAARAKRMPTTIQSG
jgi:hypothetical protein